MLLIIVLILFAGYWAFALSYVSRARAKGKKYPLLCAWTVCFGLFFGDHAAGYLWFKWYTSTISVPGPVTFTRDSLAIENYRQDVEQREHENGNGGGGGIPPIFPSLHAALYIWKPLRYEPAEMDVSPLELISSGYSRIELIDLNHQQNNPKEPPRVLVYSIFKRPDQRCAAFELLPGEQRTRLHKRMSDSGLLYATDFCIGREEKQVITAKIKDETRNANWWHPRQWTLPTLVGVYASRSRYIDVQSNQVIAEFKGAYFYGGWVWQFIRFLPDMNHEVLNGDISTKVLPVIQAPYAINTSSLN
jgi:hypothetical protein